MSIILVAYGAVNRRYKITIVKDILELNPVVLSHVERDTYYYHNSDGLYIDTDTFEVLSGSDGEKILRQYKIQNYIDKL